MLLSLSLTIVHLNVCQHIQNKTRPNKSIQDEDDWAVSDEPQEEDSDSNAVVAESALDRIACGLGGKTVFPQIMNLTPGMLQVATTMSTLQKTPFISSQYCLENVNFQKYVDDFVS